MAKIACLVFLVMFPFLVSLHPTTPVSKDVSQAQSHDYHHKQLEPYVEYVNEFTDRRRSRVYLPNEQSIFYGAQLGYVNVGRGNLTFARRDLVTIGRVPLIIARVYDSSSSEDDFGKGWRLSAAETIKIEPDRSLMMMTESSTPVRYVVSGQTYTQANPFPTDIIDIQQVDSNHFQIKLRTGFVKEFTLIGDTYCLTRVQDRNGNSVILEYQSGNLSRMRDQSKGSINIERDRTGRISSVRDHNGRRVSYEYDSNGQLSKVVDLGGNNWRYEYNGLRRLTRATNPLGHSDLAVTYDSQDRVIELKGSGQDYLYRYDSLAGRTIVTDGNGYESSYAQNSDGITTSITNLLGVTTSLVFDERNKVQRLFRNSRLQAEMGYNSKGQLSSLVKYDSQSPAQMNYSYNESGQLIEIISSTDGKRLRYDSRGNLLEKISSEGITRYRYSTQGDVLTMDFGNVLSYQFEVEADGQITSITDRRNRQTRFKYFDDGKLSQANFADGSIRNYNYDRLGMRRLRQYEGRAMVVYDYDPVGSMKEIQVRNADGTSGGQKLTLDEEQKVTVIERKGSTRTYLTYDKMGNLTAVTIGEHVLRFNYDRFNRLTEVIKSDEERLVYNYADDEPDIRLQMDHHTGQIISDRIDSGLTFSSGLELVRNRTQGSLWGVVRFDRGMNDYRLTSELGLILPDTMVNSAIGRMRVMGLGESINDYEKSFDAPSNVMFIPAEYWAVNCCPLCEVPIGGEGFVDPCPSCNPIELGGELVELYYKFTSSRLFSGPDNRPMKECIYINCPSNRGQRCFSDAGHSDYRPAAEPCADGILLVSEYLGSFLGIQRCKIINHYDFPPPFQCP